MQLHQIKRNRHNRMARRVGRGGKKGTYSGRGVKGQKARAGAKFEPAIRQWIKRYPKLRGYKFKRQGQAAQIVNLRQLEARFSADEQVNPQKLLKLGLVSRVNGKLPPVKILAGGRLSKKLQFSGCQLSKTALVKIAKVGGLVIQ